MHTNDKNTQTHPRDIRFTVLSVLGMIFIVDGHLNNSFLDWGGMFPYYSFHVPLFLFISGYFYRPDFPSEGDLSLHNLFIEPFITGHQFVYNLAAWFVPALFLVEVVNLFLRRLMGGIIKKEWFRTLLYLVIGISGILLAMSEKNTGPWLPLVRTMFFLPIYQFGVLYRAELERHDSWNGFLYFGLLFLIQMFLHLKGYRLVYEAVFLPGFHKSHPSLCDSGNRDCFLAPDCPFDLPRLEKNRAICFFRQPHIHHHAPSSDGAYGCKNRIRTPVFHLRCGSCLYLSETAYYLN